MKYSLGQYLLSSIPAMTAEEIARVTSLEQEAMKLPQVPIETDHVIHAGTYLRTVLIPAGVLITGVLISVATTLVISGDATVFTGDSTERITGYHVVPSAANRKQAFLAHADTHLTMLFPTSATSVEEAEAEFTAEPDLLVSRKDNINTITYTGETLCQEYRQLL